MTDPLEVRYLSTAQRDLIELFEYIAKDNPPAASSLLNEIDRSISNLIQNPHLGVIPKDERLRKLGYRILIIRKYLVFYVIKKDSIQIRRILHGARQFGFLL